MWWDFDPETDASLYIKRDGIKEVETHCNKIAFAFQVCTIFISTADIYYQHSICIYSSI